MKPALLFAAIAFFVGSAGEIESVAQSHGVKSIHAYLATGKGSRPSTSFSSDVPTVYVYWKGEALEAGDKIRAVWIAEDVGSAAPKDNKILEGEGTAYKADENGDFSLSRPGSRIWPIGKYRVEIYINGVVTELLRFTITPGVTIEVPKGNKE